VEADINYMVNAERQFDALTRLIERVPRRRSAAERLRRPAVHRSD
jgi:hypothetical protein